MGSEVKDFKVLNTLREGCRGFAEADSSAKTTWPFVKGFWPEEFRSLSG